MSDETRKLLKLFGVSVTDFESEADRLAERARDLAAGGAQADVTQLLQDTAELCREMNMRWLETTSHVMQIQNRLLAICAEAAAKIREG